MTDADAPLGVKSDSYSIRRSERDAILAKDGWERRFVGSPPRLGEFVSLYEEMGLEVLLDEINEDELREECGGCSLALTFFRVVYTRRPK